MKELQKLERQLEGALAMARQRKTQIMTEQMEELRRKLMQGPWSSKQGMKQPSFGSDTDMRCLWMYFPNGSLFRITENASEEFLHALSNYCALQLTYNQHTNIGFGPRLGRLRLQNKQPKPFNECKFYIMGDFEIFPEAWNLYYRPHSVRWRCS